MKYALSAMSIAFVCFVAFFTRIEGEANFTVSFNKPQTAAQTEAAIQKAATRRVAAEIPPMATSEQAQTPARKPSR